MNHNIVNAVTPERTCSNDQTTVLQYDYAYTIDIAPSKFVRGSGKWANLKHDLQKRILNTLIKDALKSSSISDTYSNACYYTFEETKKGNIHAHGSFYANTDKAYNFQKYVHKQVGIPTCPLERSCYITATEVCHSFWEKYKHKEQKRDKLDISMFF